jgi:hypothetical protein
LAAASCPNDIYERNERKGTGNVLELEAGTPSILRQCRASENKEQRLKPAVAAKSESQTMWLLAVKKAYISCVLYIYMKVDKRNG